VLQPLTACSPNYSNGGRGLLYVFDAARPAVYTIVQFHGLYNGHACQRYFNITFVLTWYTDCISSDWPPYWNPRRADWWIVWIFTQVCCDDSGLNAKLLQSFYKLCLMILKGYRALRAAFCQSTCILLIALLESTKSSWYICSEIKALGGN
jgi:hypothetical protein